MMRRILWFRRDLRSDDHPLLALSGEILPIFIFDPAILSPLPADDRRVTFIFHTLLHLKAQLRQMGREIALFYGHPEDVFAWLLKQNRFDEICASWDYDSYALERDRRVSQMIEFKRIDDTYIFAPDEILKSDGTPYLVFTPFYNRAKTLLKPDHMHCCHPSAQSLIDFEYAAIHRIEGEKHSILPLSIESIGFASAELLPHQLQTPQEKLERFGERLSSYKTDRDFFASDATSRLGVDLRFGTISIRAILRWLDSKQQKENDTEPFFRELIFREFYAMLLYHFPDLSWKNFRYPFKGTEDEELYKSFCEGRTGIPVIDAGIHELLQTGNMHNRIRMITASFFTKNLLLPWQWGEAFFARHLMDYDAASNILSWQWSAGTGIDPQPYFRIFNPWLQAKKFDSNGDYIYQWLPQLRHLSPSQLHNEIFHQQNDIPDYPSPIVDHRLSSQNALEYYKKVL